MCLCSSVVSTAHGAVSLPDLWHAACRMAATMHCKCRRLQGHGAIVTGAGCSQIGRAIALRLAQVGSSSGAFPAHNCQGLVWSTTVQYWIMWPGHGSVWGNGPFKAAPSPTATKLCLSVHDNLRHWQCSGVLCTTECGRCCSPENNCVS